MKSKIKSLEELLDTYVDGVNSINKNREIDLSDLPLKEYIAWMDKLPDYEDFHPDLKWEIRLFGYLINCINKINPIDTFTNKYYKEWFEKITNEKTPSYEMGILLSKTLTLFIKCIEKESHTKHLTSILHTFKSIDVAIVNLKKKQNSNKKTKHLTGINYEKLEIIFKLTTVLLKLQANFSLSGEIENLSQIPRKPYYKAPMFIDAINQKKKEISTDYKQFISLNIYSLNEVIKILGIFLSNINNVPPTFLLSDLSNCFSFEELNKKGLASILYPFYIVIIGDSLKYNFITKDAWHMKYKTGKTQLDNNAWRKFQYEQVNRLTELK